MKDPWPEMEIEKRCQQLVKEPETGLPSTLAYLPEMPYSRQLTDGADALINALMEKRYAIALTRLLFSETPLRSAMKLMLDDPEELPQLIQGEYLSATI